MGPKTTPDRTRGLEDVIASRLLGDVPRVTSTIGQRMRRARTASGIARQEDMADVLRVTRQTVMNWEGDDPHPSRAVLIAWAVITDCNFVWLETGVGEPATQNDGAFQSLERSPIRRMRCFTTRSELGVA
jgi:transcriptional regulator with XRE-family HTH domain